MGQKFLLVVQPVEIYCTVSKLSPNGHPVHVLDEQMKVAKIEIIIIIKIITQ